MKQDDPDPYNDAGMEQLRRRFRLDPDVIRRFRNALLKQFLEDAAARAHLPEDFPVRCHALQFFKRHDSEIDGASKLLFQTDDQLLLESVVLRIASGRNTVCISSQVGCAAACDFCATGRMGVARNLNASQIVDQVVQAGQLLCTEGRRLNNIVFMGMGEPFHNEQQVCRTVEILQAPEMLKFAPRNILVSTVGVPEAMLRFARRFPGVGMALSLHSANETVRQQLIPIASKCSVDQLHETVRELNRIQERPVMIEYLMLAGRTDSDDDADLLLKWLAGLRIRVNLIPYNAIAEAPHLSGSDRITISRFAERLRASGHQTTVRYSLGSDIAAACGQLVKATNQEGVTQASQVSINQKLRRSGKI